MNLKISLPEKEYFTFEEIADRWVCSIDSVWDLINRYLLRPMVLRSTLNNDELKNLRPSISEGTVNWVFTCVKRSTTVVNHNTTSPLPTCLYIPAFHVNPARVGVGNSFATFNCFTDFSGEFYDLYALEIGREHIPARPIYEGSDFLGMTPAHAATSQHALVSLNQRKFLAGPLLISREERDRFEALHNVGETSSNPTSSNNGSNLEWPWGGYDTKWLRFLAEAAKEHWAHYDPAKPRTAPTNKKVAEWLEAKGVSSTMSQVMATILRDDKLPKGPRK